MQTGTRAQLLSCQRLVGLRDQQEQQFKLRECRKHPATCNPNEPAAAIDLDVTANKEATTC